MDIITIDPSLSCTAVCVNNKFYVYATDNIGLTKANRLTTWFEFMKTHAEYRFFETLNKSLLHYSKLELAKLELYNRITDSIISDISLNLISPTEETIVCIEGYSYSSASSALIDLVTFSTLLRSKLVSNINAKIIVVSPSTLKSKSCELTYGCNISSKGKKLPCVNLDGVSGGRFKKFEILQALLENDSLKNDSYISMLRDKYADIKKLKKIPKPIEDINDSKIMYEIILDIAEKNDYILDIIEEKIVE